MATTGFAAVKTGTIPRTLRQRALLFDAMTPLDVDRWQLGVQFQPRSCTAPAYITVTVCEDDGTLAAGTDCVAYIEQFPFTVEDALRSTTLGALGWDLEELLRSRYEETISWAFASFLAGNSGSDAYTLSSTATAADGGFGALAAAKALAVVENELAERLRGAKGIIHMSPGMLQTIAAGGGVVVNGTSVETFSGNTIAADSGYFKAAAPTGQAASTANTNEWVYGSGPIQYAVTPLSFFDEGEPNAYTKISTNKIERYTSYQGIAIFDPCAVTAVLATY